MRIIIVILLKNFLLLWICIYSIQKKNKLKIKPNLQQMKMMAEFEREILPYNQIESNRGNNPF